MKRALFFGVLTLGWVSITLPQDAVIKVINRDKAAIAIPVFRGAGDVAPFMNAFNETLSADVEDSGLFKIVSKSLYPITIPQQPSDFRPGGSALTDWSSAPVQAKYLAFGYAASQNNQIVLSGGLLDTGQADVASGQLIAKRYFSAMDDAGVRRIAHEFAADILAKFAVESLLGSHIYFVSDRTGHKEIWSMDPDGANQKQVTRYNSITIMPALSADGTKLAFTSFAEGHPKIFMVSVDNGRRLRFDNPTTTARSTPTNTTLSFAPDGKADTDLFLSRAIDIGPVTPPQTSQPDSGGITLIE